MDIQHPSSPSQAPPPSSTVRPSPHRASTLSTAYPYLASASKGRATSQPPGDRQPNLGNGSLQSTPTSGRGSPAGAGLNGGGGDFGVIGGSRTPNRFGSTLGVSGTTTRASSFSGETVPRTAIPQLSRTLSAHVEEHPSRSSSPFPTFSPSSSPSISPDLMPPAHHSPPRADNVSRSRSQSLATGVRPDRSFLGGMTTLEADPFKHLDWRAKDSNMSPFTHGSSIYNQEDAFAPVTAVGSGRFRSPPEIGFASRPWASPLTTSALSSSLATALGGHAGFPGGGNGLDDANGGRSGSSSRRHSVSVIGGSGARRFNFNDPGAGMSSLASTGSRRGLGPLGFTDEELLPERLGNALSLHMDQNRPNPESDPKSKSSSQHASSLPIFNPLGGRGGNESLSMYRTGMAGNGTGSLPRNTTSNDPFGIPIARGRADQLEPQRERGPSDESRDSGQSRLSIDNKGLPSPARARAASVFGEIGAPSPDRARESLGSGMNMGIGVGIGGAAGVGPIGSPPARGPGGMSGIGLGAIGGGPGAIGTMNFAHPSGFRPEVRPGPFSPSLTNSPASAGPFSRPPQPPPPSGPGTAPGPGTGHGPGGYGYYPPSQQQQQMPPQRPPYPPPPGGYPYGFGPPSGSPPMQQPPPLYGGYPPVPGSPGHPTSPSFSSLSLADLGKGIPLAALPPNAPLYIVAFKAGRRDVYYCPDPTLLISNGDWVIVEADRGSDLGTVICDSLSPVDIREWQEKQATAALLSGASQHQPPGMSVPGNTPRQTGLSLGLGLGGVPPSGIGAAGVGVGGSGKNETITNIGGVGSGLSSGRLGSGELITTGEFAGADLSTLLAGVGPSGSQPEVPGIAARGPLAKEIMPKRIFAKSGQGPQEQARMLEKSRDEQEALLICREKAALRNLPMQIVDAEYQWDRRKLTFYFKADKRVDFRELTKENFRIFKSRIWMSMVPKDDPRT